MRTRLLSLLLAALALGGAPLRAQAPAVAEVPIDFSFAGYGGGGVPLPEVAAVLRVRPSGGDDTALLQAALDSVGRLAPDSSGLRGAVLLAPGTFRVRGRLRLRGGVVLRGTPGGATTIRATGTGRRSLILVGGDSVPTTAEPVAVADSLVPAGSRTLRLESVAGSGRARAWWSGGRAPRRGSPRSGWTPFPATSRISASAGRRGRGTCSGTAWSPRWTGSTAPSPSTRRSPPRWRRATAGAPSPRHGRGAAAPDRGGGPHARQRRGPVEPARRAALLDRRPARERGGRVGAAGDRAALRGLGRARRAAGAARYRGGRRSEQPVSELAGYRRQSFLVEGQQVLVLRCTAERGMNDFAVGLLAAGPNVFLADTARGALGPSGSFESWASGRSTRGDAWRGRASASPTTCAARRAAAGPRRTPSSGAPPLPWRRRGRPGRRRRSWNPRSRCTRRSSRRVRDRGAPCSPSAIPSAPRAWRPPRAGRRSA